MNNIKNCNNTKIMTINNGKNKNFVDNNNNKGEKLVI